jgi:hypothetical protein
MHKLCAWLGVLAASWSVGSACWAQSPDAGTYLILRESCELVSPGFKAATNSVNERWRRENAAAIAAVEASAEMMASLPDDSLRQVGNDFAVFKLTDSFGTFQEGFAVRHDGIGYFVYFEERNGEWLINSM